MKRNNKGFFSVGGCSVGYKVGDLQIVLTIMLGWLSVITLLVLL